MKIMTDEQVVIIAEQNKCPHCLQDVQVKSYTPSDVKDTLSLFSSCGNCKMNFGIDLVTPAPYRVQFAREYPIKEF